jgi:hypothetical protein
MDPYVKDQLQEIITAMLEYQKLYDQPITYDVWKAAFGTPTPVGFSYQSSVLRAQHDLLGKQRQQWSEQLAETIRREETIKDLIRKMRETDYSIRETSNAMEEQTRIVALAKKELAKLPVDLYVQSHDYAVSRPENSGLMDIDNKVLGALRLTYELFREYIGWGRNDSKDTQVKKLMVHPSYSNDFALASALRYKIDRLLSGTDYSQPNTVSQLNEQLDLVWFKLQRRTRGNDLASYQLDNPGSMGVTLMGFNPYYNVDGGTCVPLEGRIQYTGNY